MQKAFGQAGEKVVIEEFLEGEEASFMALTDGEHVLPLPSSQDHKRVFDNDEGPNTGGMGAYSPAPVVTRAVHDRVVREVLTPLMAGLKRQGILYRGVLYVGLMITKAGPKVLEFNARFGDPECQVIMMRLKSDLVPLLEATVNGTLRDVEPEWYEDPAVCVVLSAAGYPGSYEHGKEIRGLEKLKDWRKGFVFHAGTTKQTWRVADFRRSCVGSHRARPRSCGSRTGSLSRHHRDQMGWNALSQGHRATCLVSAVRRRAFLISVGIYFLTTSSGSDSSREICKRRPTHAQRFNRFDEHFFGDCLASKRQCHSLPY